MKVHKPILDIQQNFWTLASIQSASIVIWGMVLGWHLAKDYSPNIAIGSICVGNLLLWFIGIGIISMASKDRSNSIENIGKADRIDKFIFRWFSISMVTFTV